MTPKEINMAIAQLLGWQLKNGTWIHHSGEWDYELPDFFNSLDACAQFEQTLNYNQMNEYQNLHLADIIGKSTSWISTATPPQRCEAFLKLHGKWIN